MQFLANQAIRPENFRRNIYSLFQFAAHKLDVLRSILCDEVIKLRGSSTSIKGESISLKGIDQRLSKKFNSTLQAKQIEEKIKNPPLSRRKASRL